MNEREIEQRQKALSRTCGVCPICKMPLLRPQFAHKISNKIMWRNKYGSWVIDHTLNGELVDCLKCNQAVDIGSSYGNHLEVIADILIYEYQKMWGAEGLNKLSDKLLEKYNLYGVENGTEKK